MRPGVKFIGFLVMLSALLLVVLFFWDPRRTGGSGDRSTGGSNSDSLQFHSNKVSSGDHHEGLPDHPEVVIFKEVGNDFYLESEAVRVRINFEDGALERRMKRIIVEDLQRVFGHLKPVLQEEANIATLLFEGKGAYGPALLSLLWMLHLDEEGYYMEVSRDVSNGYMRASEFLLDHGISMDDVRDMIQKFYRAGFDASNNEESAKNWLVVLSQPVESNGDLKEALQYLASGVIREPSILTFQEYEIGGETFVVAATGFLEYKDAAVVFAQQIWMVLHEGRWKFAL